MITLTLKDARRYAEETIAEKGADYVYPRDRRPHSSCLYVYNDKPDCLVGVILHKAGVPIEALRQCQSQKDSSAIAILPLLRQAGFILTEPEVTQWLINLQHAQDSGDTWGEALRYAEQLVRT